MTGISNALASATIRRASVIPPHPCVSLSDNRVSQPFSSLESENYPKSSKHASEEKNLQVISG